MKNNPSILIIDDQEIFEFISPLLNKSLVSPHITHCKTNREALGYIASGLQADIIIANWDLTGHGFLENLRRDLENHNTPIIIMSEDTQNKKIILNSLNRKVTFFLAKPFLKKGFNKKLAKVLSLMEQRRKNRLRPNQNYKLKVALSDKQYISLLLVDISIDGCLFRASIETSKLFSIYQKTVITLNINEFNLQQKGEVFRIGHDIPIPEKHDSVLIMIKFSDSQQNSELQEAIDELGKRW